ncbi:MAG UNVERIFIED_CONTAM: hypothetical protein LVT10_02800 [Anaerolineae bacterium]|jgi:beta-glucosidase
MCAYNRVNGDFCAENAYLLTHVLRERWGYEGFVMSDWGAVHDRVRSVMAGLELEMPGPSPHRTQALIEAVQKGELDESVLNVAVERLLKIILKAQETPKGNQPLNVEGNHALARRVASECIVLLKNKDDLLPLKGTEHVAVIGQAATTPVYQGAEARTSTQLLWMLPCLSCNRQAKCNTSWEMPLLRWTAWQLLNACR